MINRVTDAKFMIEFIINDFTRRITFRISPSSKFLVKWPTMAEEENIKVVVRIRDLIPREKGQEKVSVLLVVLLSSPPLISGFLCSGRQGNRPEGDGQELDLRQGLQPSGGQ